MVRSSATHDMHHLARLVHCTPTVVKLLAHPVDFITMEGKLLARLVDSMATQSRASLHGGPIHYTALHQGGSPHTHIMTVHGGCTAMHVRLTRSKS